MAKMKLFGLLFSFFNLLLINWTPILASNAMKPARLEQCNLPAPDSFRITQVGGDLIKLAWNPIFPGAQHQLIIMESDGNGGYVTILVENNVSGDAYNANNLLPGTSYRFVIATKCASGDPSEIKSIIDGITLIVDLAIEGRKPALKGVSGDCSPVPTSYNWKGFKVSGFAEGQYYENYFEFNTQLPPVSGPLGFEKIQILRYGINDAIVASSDGLNYPDCFIPIISNRPPRIRIDMLLNGGPNYQVIGYVDISKSSAPSAITACPDYLYQPNPWNPNFVLTPIYSPKAEPAQSCPQPKPRDLGNKGFDDYFWTNNPFSDEIVLGCINPDKETVGFTLQLFNSYGALCYEQKFDSIENQIIVQLQGLPKGIYLMQIRGKAFVVNKKIIKK